MNFKNTTFRTLLIIIGVIVTMYACAGTGSLKADNVNLYYETIDKMVEVSRNAVENKGYAVTNIHERLESQRVTIAFANRTTAGRQLVSSMQSNIHLAEVDTADAIVVRIDNPKYNYGTPTDQRIDYAKILFEEIDKLLE